jgi:hypothetical protein
VHPLDRWQRSLFFKAHFISKLNALLKCTEYLPASSDAVVQAVEKPKKLL